MLLYLNTVKHVFLMFKLTIILHDKDRKNISVLKMSTGPHGPRPVKLCLKL